MVFSHGKCSCLFVHAEIIEVKVGGGEGLQYEQMSSSHHPYLD